MSNNPSSAGAFSTNSSAVGFGSSASTNVVRSDSDASTASGNSGSFINPWAVPKSDIGHLGMPGGRLARGVGNEHGNGGLGPRSLPLREAGAGEELDPGLKGPLTDCVAAGAYKPPPHGPPTEARASDGAFNELQGPRDRYRSV